MNKVIDTITSAQKANLQAAESLATKTYAGAEKLVELNLAATKAAVSESFGHMQALMGAKDIKDVVALQTAFLQPLAGKSAAYVEHVKTIATDSTSEFTDAMEAKIAELDTYRKTVEVERQRAEDLAMLDADAQKALDVFQGI